MCDVTGPCTARYWCMNGSSTPTPIDGVRGVLCPEGHFCAMGTPVPEPCPVGTWSNSTGLGISSECQLCSGGHYCNGTGLAEPSGPCNAGFYCTNGAKTPMPNDSITGAPCTVGHYCPEGTYVPRPCKDGTYMTNTGAENCWNCTAGHYCVTGLDPELCPPGFYCPQGTGVIWQSCPPGTFSMLQGLWHVDNCTQCSGGRYCSKINATAVTGLCSAGYYCTSGSNTASPEINNTGVASPCPPGHYCPEGTSTPLPCPLGTFSNKTRVTISGDCTACSYGHFCGETGLVKPSGLCWAGFYCLTGAQVPNNPTVDVTGGPCPPGHYCPNGTSYPLGCLAGTYNPTAGMSQCSPCPTGFYCPENSTTYQGNLCPAGHYCPEGTGEPHQFPCSQGYTNPATGKCLD